MSSLRRGHANLLCIESNFSICAAEADTGRPQLGLKDIGLSLAMPGCQGVWFWKQKMAMLSFFVLKKSLRMLEL